MRYLGCDPGLSGGLALLEEGPGRLRVLDVIDIPTLGEAAKRRVDVLGVMKFIQRWNPDHGGIERAQAMPDQGSSSGYIYGRAVGALEACLTGCMIPWSLVEASVWKRAAGLIGQDKEGSRQRALSLFPEAHGWLARKKDHNRSEAIMIARHVALLAAAGPMRAARG